MNKTFTNFTIKKLELNNRIVMAPMCMYSADNNGMANDFHFVHYVTRAIGKVGLIIMEATAVEKRGRITENDLGLWDDSQIEPLKRIVTEAHKYGAKVGIQLGHAGRKCGIKGERIIAPSDIRFDENYEVPNQMSEEEIEVVVTTFATAADRANKAGFDTIEIHGAHGYLINQFLSPLTNKRSDKYGKDKSLFLREVLKAVKSSWPLDKPIILRVSANEYNENGNHVEDIIKVLNDIRDDIDIVDVSSGGVIPASINTYPGYQVNYSDKIKMQTGLCTIGGGIITNPYMVEEILSNDRADLVFLGRELLRNPYFGLEASTILKEEIEWPRQYKRAR